MRQTFRFAGVGLLVVMTGCGPRIQPIGSGRAFDPNDDERRLWAASREQSATFQSSGALYRNAELQAYVQSVLDRLTADRREEFAPLEPRVFVIDSAAVNAFTLPHGNIYVHTGILGRMRNEAQLAMLLGHEWTHATNRHSYMELKNAYETSGAVSYLAVLGSVGGGEVQSLAGHLGGLFAVAAITGYSRVQESEADRTGLVLAARAGYDPREASRMFQRMLDAADKADRGWNFFYATHPKMEQRAASCARLVDHLSPSDRAGATDIGQDRYVAAALPLIYDEVERHIVQGKFELAGETLLFLSAARPDDAAVQAYVGDLNRARAAPGDAERAQAAYEASLRMSSTQPRALRGLGLLCVRQKRNEEAGRYLTAYLAAAPDAVDAEFVRQTLARLTSE